MLDTGAESIDFEGTMAKDVRDAALGKGDEELYEKKLTKEEKKALAKAKREAKKKVRLRAWGLFILLPMKAMTNVAQSALP